jgi:hypothetical protein
MTALDIVIIKTVLYLKVKIVRKYKERKEKVRKIK